MGEGSSLTIPLTPGEVINLDIGVADRCRVVLVDEEAELDDADVLHNLGVHSVVRKDARMSGSKIELMARDR